MNSAFTKLSVGRLKTRRPTALIKTDTLKCSFAESPEGIGISDFRCALYPEGDGVPLLQAELHQSDHALSTDFRAFCSKSNGAFQFCCSLGQLTGRTGMEALRVPDGVLKFYHDTLAYTRAFRFS